MSVQKSLLPGRNLVKDQASIGGGAPADDQPAKGGGEGELRGTGGTERGLGQMSSHTCWKRDRPLLPW